MKRLLAFLAVLVALVAGIAQAADYSVTTDITVDKNITAVSTAAIKAYDPTTTAGVNSIFGVADESDMWLIALDSLDATGMEQDTTGAISYAIKAPNDRFPGARGDIYYVPDEITVACKVGLWRPKKTFANYPVVPPDNTTLGFSLIVAMDGADDPAGPWTNLDADVMAMSDVTSADSILTISGSTGWYRYSETTSTTTGAYGAPKYVRFRVYGEDVTGTLNENSHVWVQHLYFVRRFNFAD